jgi:hypothetical protein
LVFTPENTGVRAKPMGHLINAKQLANQDEDRTLAVTTKDALHRVIRFTFGDIRSASDFAQLAMKASIKEGMAAKQAERNCASARSEAKASSELEAEVRKHLASSTPALFGAVDLYGPEPEGRHGSEVLLGRGVLALVDPPIGEKTLGSYQLLFFSEDEGVREISKRFEIGPKMGLKRQCDEDQLDADGPVASFVLPAHRGVPAHTITFNHPDVAESFARDYRVRQRLMEVAHKTAGSTRQVGDLRGQLEDLKQRSLYMRLLRFLCFVSVLTVIGCVVRLAMIYAEDTSKSVPELLQAVTRELGVFSRMWRNFWGETSNEICQLVVGTVPADQVKKCAAVTGNAEVRKCIEHLVG